MLIVIESDKFTRDELRLMSPNVRLRGVGCHSSPFSFKFGDRGAVAVLDEERNMEDGGSFQPPAGYGEMCADDWLRGGRREEPLGGEVDWVTSIMDADR